MGFCGFRATALLKVIATALTGLATARHAQAETRAALIFNDNMVLQRQMPAPVWGWATAGDQITIEFAGQIKKAVAAKDGKWQVALDPMEASDQGRDLVISNATSGEHVTLHDVLVGEVWICCGQSNMEWGVGQESNGKEIIAAADHPTIRLFMVPHAYSLTPQPDLLKIGPDFKPDTKQGGLTPIQKENEKNGDAWRPCTPTNIAMYGWNGFSCAAYFFALDLQKALHVPVGLVQCSFGGSNLRSYLALEGEPAEAPKSTTRAKLHAWDSYVKYNAMIHPLVPMAIRGALWHQGESDVGGLPTGLPYFNGLKALIGGWRKVWGEGDFSFYLVMTGPYRDWKDDSLPHHWMSQVAALSIHNTGLVVTSDIGEPWDLHPHHKDVVGHRLALWALAKTYGVPNLVYSGPIYQGFEINGDTIKVKFASVGSGLVSTDGKPLTGFEIAGEDKQFALADATIDGDCVNLHSSTVPHPLAVRFGWTWSHPKAPAPVVPPNFANKEGLPAASFNSEFINDGTMPKVN